MRKKTVSFPNTCEAGRRKTFHFVPLWMGLRVINWNCFNKKNDTLNRTLSRVAVFIDNMQMILDFSVDISETLFYAKVDSCAIHMTLFRCGAWKNKQTEFFFLFTLRNCAIAEWLIFQLLLKLRGCQTEKKNWLFNSRW